MKSSYIIGSTSLLVGAVLLISWLIFSSTPTPAPSDSAIAAIPDSSANQDLGAESGAPVRRQNNSAIISSEITQNQIQLALDEISTRFELDQSEEALNELNGLLGRYDSMSHTEKRDLLDAYAKFFRQHSLNSDAIFFYEEILKLPDLKQSNRQALLQLLAIMAVGEEDWNGFLGYYDRYFEAGGEYNWVMTRSLTGAYQRLENYDAAGDSMLLHFQTGIHPRYDGSNEQYQRLYARYESIPLDMTNSETALALAHAMVEEFDMPGNWKVLAELHQSHDNTLGYSNTLATAQQKGYVDSSGNWLN